MSHAQKQDFVFRRNGRVHLNRRGASVQSTTGSRGVRISGSNAGYTMFRGRVKSTGYPLHSRFPFTSPPVRYRVPSHFSWSLHIFKFIAKHLLEFYKYFWRSNTKIEIPFFTVVTVCSLTAMAGSIPEAIVRFRPHRPLELITKIETMCVGVSVWLGWSGIRVAGWSTALQPNHTETPTHIEPRTIRPMW